MIVPGDRVAVAVSGGGDSVALLLLLMELRETLGATLRVAHFNHRLRPVEADEDEQFVRKLAADLGLPCIVRSEDLAARVRDTGANLEAEARARRYAFLRGLVSRGWATRIATGHTADDQAETVLARMGRGSGLKGLRAIHPVLGPVVRPSIETRRADLRNYLASRNQIWREDSTNRDTSRLRARIRHGLLPAWEAEFGESGVRSLGRLADLARNDDSLIDELVEAVFLRLALREASKFTFNASEILNPFPELKSPLARQSLASRLVRRVAVELNHNLQGLTAAHVTRVLRLAHNGTSGSRVVLPGGLVVERALDRLIFSSSRVGASFSRQRDSYSYFADPWPSGEAIVQIAETGKRLRLKLIDWPTTGRETYLEGSGVLDADRLEPPLLVRSGLPGDSYRPRGRMHAAKLKRLLLERRIAGRDRALWPVLTSAGRLVWTKGLPVAADFAANAATRRVLIVREELGEPYEVQSFGCDENPLKCI
jgi:tRNA(Ile)-lysidine synthase